MSGADKGLSGDETTGAPPSASADPKRIEDMAVLAPILGLTLLSPAVLNLIAQPLTLFGAPFIAVYIFALWLAMIAAAFVLARRLRHRADNGKGA